MPEDISTRLRRIAELALEDPQRSFLNLAHYIDIKFLRAAYDRTRKDGATGVDGQTAREYEEKLEENLRSLLDRFKSGTYKAPPVRRTYIPKGDGKATRPIGIPTFEDKVLQRAVTMVLEAVYERDFLDCSYGYRPGRSARQALDALWRGLMRMGGGWVLEADIKGFFDTLDHVHLRNFLDLRVRDGVLRRAIGKWLNAGVLEEGYWHQEATGTPQGGVISPLLANIYLHEVLDKWFTNELLPGFLGRAFLIRFADDFILVFSSEKDARQVMSMLPERFRRYGLSIHPTKTRLLHFRPKDRTGGPRTFDFLGFTHHWELTRRKRWVVKLRTSASRFRRTLKRLALWLRKHRHRELRWQHERLCKAIRGHDAYYGIVGNYAALKRLRRAVTRLWRKWLDRRSHNARVNWVKMKHLLARWPLPRPVIYHRKLRPVANPLA
jgi:group II intron reverse transcriptase/maturase